MAYLRVESLEVLLGHQSAIPNYSCWLSPHHILIFPVLDQRHLELVIS